MTWMISSDDMKIEIYMFEKFYFIQSIWYVRKILINIYITYCKVSAELDLIMSKCHHHISQDDTTTN